MHIVIALKSMGMDHGAESGRQQSKRSSVSLMEGWILDGVQEHIFTFIRGWAENISKTICRPLRPYARNMDRNMSVSESLLHMQLHSEIFFTVTRLAVYSVIGTLWSAFSVIALWHVVLQWGCYRSCYSLI